MQNQKHCLDCGGSVKKKNIKGATFPWKDFPSVMLCFDVFLMTCDNCGEFAIRRSETKNLDKALKDSVHQQTTIYLNTLMKKLSLNQKDLSEKIRITQVYLSELIRGKKTPSYNFYKLLKIYSQRPELIEEFDIQSCDKEKQLQGNKLEKLIEKYNFMKNTSDIEKYFKITEFQGIASI